MRDHGPRATFPDRFFSIETPKTFPREVPQLRKRCDWRRARLLLALALLLCCAGMTPNTALGAIGTLSFSPTAANFGNVTVGTTKTISVTITNIGTANVSFSKVSLVANMYSLSGITMPLTLSPGAHVTMAVKFAPLQTELITGYVVFGSNASNSLVDYQLSGTGVTGALTATPSSASFGSVPVGTTNSQTVQLKNTETTTVSISGATLSGSSEFKLCSLTYPISLGAGQTVNCTVSFAASATGSVTGSVTFTSNATNKMLAVPLSAAGVTATRVLTAMPTSLNFGNVTMGSSEMLAVSLKNTGNSSVTVSGISVTGADITTTGGVSGATINPGQTATLKVTFSPKQAETVSGSVAVSSNATGSPTKISVAGVGVSSTAHLVTLAWTASTSSGIAGYNVYRATARGTTYVKLTSSLVSGTKYVDSSVVAGDTYTYVVTAVTTQGAESEYSTAVTAVVP
jgi:hypothetical protein